MGVASLIIGIISLILSCVPFCNIIMLIPAIVGMILGIIATINKNKKGMAIAGLIICIISIIIIFIDSVTLLSSNIQTGVGSIEETEEAFKTSCSTHTYEELARNPEQFKGKKVKFTGQVVQTMYDGNNVGMRINVTKIEDYFVYYNDSIYVTYTAKDGESKFLEDDIVNFWGIANGEFQYTSVLKTTVTIPEVNAKYIERVK